MKKRSGIRCVTWALVCMLYIASMISAAYAVNPEKPDAITYLGNRTASYPLGTQMNRTRGYLHVIRITHAQPTIKWLGYVGNVTGTIALKDESSYALFDWTSSAVSGEVYATKESTGMAGTIYGGGIPSWTGIKCANGSMIKDEHGLFNHSATDADGYNKTFKSSPFVLTSFYAGDTLVTDTSVPGPAANCFGLNLNINNTHNAANATWQEVVLTDLTSEDESADSQYGKPLQFDIIYAAKISNQSYGYNKERYDFQMLLPQSGRQGSVAGVAFYFYIELV